MRVLLVGTGAYPIPPTGYGAIERILAEYRDALVLAGHAAEVVQTPYGAGAMSEFRFAYHLPALLRGRSFDVVHASTPVVANRLAHADVPYVYTSHSRTWYLHESWRHRWGYWLERRAVRSSAATVALTPDMERIIRGTVTPLPNLLRVIPYGIDARRLDASWSSRNGRRALGVGVVLPLKGWAWAAAALRGTGIRFDIAGPVLDAAYGDQVVAAGDNVGLLGEVTEDRLRDLYAQADFLVHPSQVEVLPRSVLEAMASGLPVLGSSVIASLVSAGDTGWAAPSGSTPDHLTAFLRSHALDLAKDPTLRRRMGEAAQAQVRSTYSWDRVVAANVALYREVLAARA